MDPRELAESVSLKLARTAPQNLYSDSWSNLATGLGVLGRDKKMSATAQACDLPYDALAELYRASDIAQNIVDIPAGEMIREWLDLRIEGEEKKAEAVGALVDKLKTKERFREALRWQRLFGGAGILIGVNDGVTDLSKPVNEKAIKSVDYLTAFDPVECRVTEWENNPLAADYGQPKMYGIYPRVWGVGASSMLQNVHASRVVRFSGVVANRAHLLRGFGFGDSIMIRCYEAIRDFASAHGGVASLVQDFSQAVFTMRGLGAAMASDKEGLIKKRLALMDFTRSMLGAILLDAEGETFERKSTPVTGLDELLDKLGSRLAAAARMPQIMLFGETPGGLGDKGSVNLEIFHKQIAMDQESDLTPAFMKIANYVMLAKGSPTRGKIPDNVSCEWRPLSELSEPEQASRNLAQAQADQIYLTTGVLSAEEVLNSRFKGDRYSLETQVDDAPAAVEPGPDDTVPRMDPATGEPVEMKPGETKPAPAPAPGAPTAPVGVAGKPIPGAAAGTPPKAADSALSGQQATFMLSVIQEVNNEQISPEQGIQVLIAALYMEEAEATAVIGKPFKPKAPEPSPDLVAKLATQPPPGAGAAPKPKPGTPTK